MPSTWSSPSPRSLMSCRRATTPTTSRRPILTAVRSAHLSARVVPAGCLPGRTPARRQWHIACSVGPPGLQACGDISSALAPQLGGRGRRELHVDVGQTASGPPLGGPRRISTQFSPPPARRPPSTGLRRRTPPRREPQALHRHLRRSRRAILTRRQTARTSTSSRASRSSRQRCPRRHSPSNLTGGVHFRKRASGLQLARPRGCRASRRNAPAAAARSTHVSSRARVGER